jgi:hypothetical protein
VYGVDGLKVGGGCGGGGAVESGCACAIATPKKATHPATKNLASATRSNLVVCIAVSFEPVYRHGPRGLTTLPSIRRFRRGPGGSDGEIRGGIADPALRRACHRAGHFGPDPLLDAGYLLPAIRGRRIERATFYC